MFVKAGLESELDITLLTVAGDRNETHLCGVGLLAQLSCERIAIHSGQSNVEERESRAKGLDVGQRRWAIVGDARFAAERMQNLGKHLGAIRVVIYNEHLTAAHTPVLSETTDRIRYASPLSWQRQ